jgi:DNA-binding CsgD family transcriptional regulator
VDTSELDHRASRLALGELELEATCLAFDALLRRSVPYAAAAWSTQDPSTGLFTSCTVSGMPKDLEREAGFFSYEFRDAEPNTFGSMISEGRTVAVLSEDTDGRLDRAARYREMLRELGCADEIRAVLWADGQPWGTVVLYGLERRFTPGEAASVATLAPHAARGLRLVLLRAAASRPEAVADPPGVLRVGLDGRVAAITRPGQRWLELGGPPLATAANAVAAAVRGNHGWEGATSRLSLSGSRLLSLHASRAADSDTDVAVIVDSARPAEIAAMLVDAYALTPRQREVLRLLLLGRSMTQIAGHLGISEHTANDHRKAIYARVGVSSRAELAARLQSDHYTPRSVAGVAPSPYGGFIDG